MWSAIAIESTSKLYKIINAQHGMMEENRVCANKLLRAIEIMLKLWTV
jgi:hypothetical protein